MNWDKYDAISDQRRHECPSRSIHMAVMIAESSDESFTGQIHILAIAT